MVHVFASITHTEYNLQIPVFSSIRDIYLKKKLFLAYGFCMIWTFNYSFELKSIFSLTISTQLAFYRKLLAVNKI